MSATKAMQVNQLLANEYPDARCELDYSTPLELLVATVLSAQCTDARANQVTPELFQKYPTPADYARASRSELENILRPLGFQRAKAGHLIGIGEALAAHEAFVDGEVPASVEELVALPGVGRKTALVVLGNAYDMPGLTVDTHFARLMGRLGLSHAKTPLAIERDIASQVDSQEWTMFSHRIIFHGRRVCTARKPRCEDCVLAQLCEARI